MTYQVRKFAYADGRAYQYHIVDEAGQLRYVAERAGMLLPQPTIMTEFFDAQHNLRARLRATDTVPWQRPTCFELRTGPELGAVQAVIEEQWRPVDEMLLRLPVYELRLGEQRFVARGSRYGYHLYEIFRPLDEDETAISEPAGRAAADAEPQAPDQPQAEETQESTRSVPAEARIGLIESPTTGPSYIVEAVAAPLREAVLPLAALAVLIDASLYS